MGYKYFVRRFFKANTIDKIKSLDMLELDSDEIAALEKYRKANGL